MIRVIQTYGHQRYPHKTLLIHGPGFTLFAWIHRPEKPWHSIGDGSLCVGLVVLSINFFTPKAFE